jgi:hypothetical protein
MAYIGFDLDETLGCFSSGDVYMYFVFPECVYRGQLKAWKPFTPSDTLNELLARFLNIFAICLAEKEPGLGLLRPGIKKIMKRIAQARTEGQVSNVAIYSNNGNLGLLLLASKMIEHLIEKPDFFCNHVDWYNPMRSGEIVLGNPGAATKSVTVLKQIFADSKCGSVANIDNSNLLFFDDLVHTNIKDAIGPTRYFNVNPYKRDAPYDVLTECFQDAMERSGIKESSEYLDYITPILSAFGLEKTFANIQTAIDINNSKYKLNSKPFINDTSAILTRLNTLFPSTNYSENYFPVVDGGQRTKKRLPMRLRLRHIPRRTRHRVNRKYIKRTRKN